MFSAVEASSVDISQNLDSYLHYSCLFYILTSYKLRKANHRIVIHSKIEMSEVRQLEKDTIQNENRMKLESILASFCELLPSGDISALHASIQSLDQVVIVSLLFSL